MNCRLLTATAGIAAALAQAAPASPDPDAPAEITLTTPAGTMRYDRTTIDATPGARLRLTFANHDAMPHNIVFCHPLPDRDDKGLEVAQAAWALGADGFARDWIPDNPRIWAASRMVGAHESQTFDLTVPDAPGSYPFVCTFPGHAMAMHGELRVRVPGPPLRDLRYRLFLGDWDRLPDFSQLSPHREGAIPDNLLDTRLEGMSEHFAVQFAAKLDVPEDGNYRFELTSDDGANLFVDGRRIVEYDGIHAAGGIRRARVRLTRGEHDFRVDYFEAAGEEHLYVAWAGKSFGPTPLSRWVPESVRDDRQDDRDRFTGMPIAPQNGEAAIYRNFIAGSGPRSIAVGYPNGVNLCFDAGALTTSLLWRGAFIDAKRHWTDRGAGFAEPLGFDVARVTPDGPALAVLPDAAAPWPQTTDAARTGRFLGYRLEDHRFPVFRWSTAGVESEERWIPHGSYESGNECIDRAVSLTSPDPPPHLLLRLAAGNIHPHGDGWKVDSHLVVDSPGAFVREAAGSRDLVVAPNFAGGRAEIRARYRWLSQELSP